MNLHVEEYINVIVLVNEEETAKALNSLKEVIAAEIRAKELIITIKEEEFKIFGEAYVKDWDINGEAVKIATSLGKN